QGEPTRARRRGRHGLSGGLSDDGHRVRRSRGSRQPGAPRQGIAVRLRAAGRTQYPSPHELFARARQSASRSMNPILQGHYSYASITDKIADTVLVRPAHWTWQMGFALSCILTALFIVMMSYLFAKGVGIWGVNEPVSWAFALTNFVWWVGIG